MKTTRYHSLQKTFVVVVRAGNTGIFSLHITRPFNLHSTELFGQFANANLATPTPVELTSLRKSAPIYPEMKLPCGG